jgi:acetyl-CoA C-acetyltransferase
MSKESAAAAITGVGQTCHTGPKRRTTLTDMIFEATRLALADAELSRGDIDAVVLGAHDLIDGRGISSMITATAAGAMFKDEIRVADDGAIAAVLGCMRVMSGEFKTVLVASWAKTSEGDVDAIENLGGDPVYLRPIGLNGTLADALDASAFLERHPGARILANDIVVHNRAAGSRNPNAHLREPVSEQDVQRASMVATPLTTMDLAPRSDGACALIIQARDVASARSGPVAWISGLGWATERYLLGHRDFGRIASAEVAAENAYRMAGIGRPSEEIGVAELHAISSFQELMLYEALRLLPPAPDGGLDDAYRSLRQKGPKISPSGGAACANPYTATGLVRLAEAALQVTQRSPCQCLSPSGLAVAHAASGFGAQSNAVFILSSFSD